MWRHGDAEVSEANWDTRGPVPAFLPIRSFSRSDLGTWPRLRPVTRTLLVLLAVVGLSSPPTYAASTRAIRQAAQYVMKNFTNEVGDETVQTLSAKLTQLVRQHGDGAIAAFKKIGPRTFRLAEEAGEHSGAVVKLMARKGPEALWVVGEPQRMALFVRFGDEAAEVMIQHKGIVEPLIEQFATPAVRALRMVDGQNARRLAMMAQEGELARIGRTQDLLGVVEKYGNRGADFLWRNKGTLAVGTVLTVFLKDPKPFFDGTRDLAQIATEPVILATTQAVKEAARRTDWTFVTITVVLIAGGLIAFRIHRARTAKSGPDGS